MFKGFKKDEGTSFIEFIFVMGCLVGMLMLSISFLRQSIAEAAVNYENNTIRTESCLEVVDKEKTRRVIYNGKTIIPLHSYYITVAFEDELTEKVSCSASEYNSIKLGDMVDCVVTTDKEGKLFDIDLVNLEG